MTETTTITHGYEGTALSSLRIFDLIENSEPVETNALINARYQVGTLSEPNVKIELALKYGAVTSKCPAFTEIDLIIKKQLYSRDMADYTTSVFTHDSVTLDVLMRQVMTVEGQLSHSENELFDEYQTASRLYSLQWHVKWNMKSDSEMLNLFHSRKTSS